MYTASLTLTLPLYTRKRGIDIMTTHVNHTRTPYI